MKKFPTLINLLYLALLKLNISLIDHRKLRQKLLYSKILDLIPSTKGWLKTLEEWNPDEKLEDTTPIYVMWWTGLETMPQIVNLCFENLQRNAKNHPVILITRVNIFSIFPAITEPIRETIELFESSKICIQHFSDIIRTLIIGQGGGIWIDATVFLTPDWDRDIIGKSFYSGRRTSAYANSGRSITKGQWTSYFIASVKGNPLITFLHDGLLECYKREGKIEEYYTMDYLFAIGLKKSSIIRRIISEVPMINANLFGLEAMMQIRFEKEELEAFMSSAPFFKLDHRKDFSRIDDNGKQTVFGHLWDIYDANVKDFVSVD